MILLVVAIGLLAMVPVVWATHHMYVMMFVEITVDGITYKFKDVEDNLP